MAKDLKQAIRERRSYYRIAKRSPAADEELKELVAYALKYTPSAFHSQSSRAVLLLHREHEALWEMTADALREELGGALAQTTRQKINGFYKGYATVLFYIDTQVTARMAGLYPLYANRIPLWDQHANAMLQYTVWTLLEAAGLGASLQHYNPLIDGRVQERWDLPEHWELVAQMPFGAPAEEPEAKTFEPIGKRFLVYG